VRSLVIGGTGPTGPFLVNGLRARGHTVTILHSGRHEVAEIPADVEHVHTDPFDAAALAAALGPRTFDLCLATYGRLRRIAETMAGRTGRFLSIGGAPAYRGYMNPWLFAPAGLPVPTREDAELVRSESDDEKGFRIARTEEAVFAHHPGATHFRYPIVYGPRQPLPREWSIVRRALDGRRALILPEDGLTLSHHGYAENVAHAVLLAVDRPEATAGEIFHCGDEEVLTLRQVVEIVAGALGHRFEIVSMPWELAVPARPLLAQPAPTHRVLDLAKLRHRLGYRDVVPAREALARTARWLAAHPPAPGGPEETVLQDPFDYAAEDALVEAWRRALSALPEVRFAREPGYTMGYSGPPPLGGKPSPASSPQRGGARPRSRAGFE
jgi:nucleoside-diphosphate-sugar epimerase